MRQKVIKTGHSLAITIPARFVRIVGIRPGQWAFSKPDTTRGSLTYTFPNATQLPLISKS